MTISEYYLSLNYFPRSAYYNLHSIYPYIKKTGSEPCSKPPHLSIIMVDWGISSAWLGTGTLHSNSIQICYFSIGMSKGKCLFNHLTAGRMSLIKVFDMLKFHMSYITTTYPFKKFNL